MLGISINSGNVSINGDNYEFYTLENALKFNAVRQNNGILDWNHADRLIRQLPNNAIIRGHIQVAHWSVNQDVPSVLLKEFIIKTIQKYPQITKWDLVGEAIADVGKIRKYWERTEFSIPNIINWANEANPTNTYYYSDYNLKSVHKWKKAIELCNELNLGLAIQFRHHWYGRVWAMNLDKWLQKLKSELTTNILISELEILCDNIPLKKQCQNRVIAAANKAKIDVCLWDRIK